MTIFVRDTIEESFIKLIPIIIIKRINEQSKGIRYKKMNKYLTENFKVSIPEVVKFLSLKGFSYNKVKKLYTININYNIIEPKSQVKLDALIRLIDYGNDEIRGIDLIDSSVKYVINNIMNLYRAYRMQARKGDEN